MRVLSLIVASAALAGIMLAGCGGGGTKTIKTGNGSLSVSNKLPDSFPGDFPVYKGADVQGSYSANQNGISGLAVTWQTGDSFDDVTAFYTDKFKSGGWKASANGTVGDSSYWAGENASGTKAFYLAVSKSDGNTSIIGTVGDKEQAGSSSDTPESADTPAAGSTASSSSSSTPESAALPTETKLPADFPSERVPMPSGSRVTQASSVSSGGQKTYFVEVYVKDTPEQAAEFFKTELPKHDWTEALTSQANGEFFGTYTAADGAEGVTVTSTASDTTGYAQVTLTVNVTG